MRARATAASVPSTVAAVADNDGNAQADPGRLQNGVVVQQFAVPVSDQPPQTVTSREALNE